MEDIRGAGQAHRSQNLRHSSANGWQRLQEPHLPSLLQTFCKQKILRLSVQKMQRWTENERVLISAPWPLDFQKISPRKPKPQVYHYDLLSLICRIEKSPHCWGFFSYRKSVKQSTNNTSLLWDKDQYTHEAQKIKLK